MNFIKRMMCSIIRCRTKSLLLLLIVFLLGNLISASFAIQKTTASVKEDMRAQLGATVTISAGDEIKQKYIDIFAAGNWHSEWVKYDSEIIDVFNTFVDDEKVAYMDIAVSYGMYTRDIACVKYEENDTGIFDSLRLYSLKGESEAEFWELRNNKIVLTAGRTFTEEEILSGANVVIISENFQHTAPECGSITEKKDEFNNIYSYTCNLDTEPLQVGDTITMLRKISVSENEQETLEEEVEFTVIGIYKNLVPSVYNGFEVTEQLLDNNIYMPYTTVLKEYQEYMKFREDFVEEHQNEKFIEVSDYYNLCSLSAKLNDPEYVEQFGEKIEQMYKKKVIFGIQVLTSADAYEAVAGPLESLSSISGIMLGVSFLISIIVLSLVITLFLKDRRFEIGIYAALGERKWKIMTQMILEVYLIGILSISLSLYSGNIIGKMVSSEILQSQIEKQQEIIENKLEKLQVVNQDNINLNTIEKEYNVEFDKQYIVSMYLIGSLVLLMSGFIPIRYTLRVDPKKILM